MRIEVFDYDNIGNENYIDSYSFKVSRLYPSSWTQVYIVPAPINVHNFDLT